MLITQSYIQIKEEDFSPLKVCLKFNPPAIALYYKLTQFPNKWFLHHVDIRNEIEADMTAENIYNKLLEPEDIYWNTRNILKSQIIRLIEKLMKRRGEVIKSKCSGNQSEMDKTISITSSGYCSPAIVTDVSPLVIGKPKNVIVDQLAKFDTKLNLNGKDEVAVYKDSKEGENRGELIKEENIKMHTSVIKEQDKQDLEDQEVDSTKDSPSKN